jgi:1-acyl-sn-glycerol-3-phosphate acyltransferase
MTVRLQGRPPDHALLVANHMSYVDIILIATQIDAVFVAKSEVASWPVIGHLCRAIDTIFVDRSVKRDVVRVGREIRARIDRGLGVAFFPEGTSSDGTLVLPFRSSLLEVAAREAIPVHWTAIRYRVAEGEVPAEQSVCWWGDMEFLPHLRRLLGVRSFEATIRFCDEPIASDDRKALAGELRSAIASAAGVPERDDDERRFAAAAASASRMKRAPALLGTEDGG